MDMERQCCHGKRWHRNLLEDMILLALPFAHDFALGDVHVPVSAAGALGELANHAKVARCQERGNARGCAEL